MARHISQLLAQGFPEALTQRGSAGFPEKKETKEGKKDIIPEHASGVARGEIVGGDDLVDVADGGAEHETSHCGHGADAQCTVWPEGHEAEHGISEAGPTDFRLERALRPADELGDGFTEKHVADEVVEKRHADAEEKKPTQDGFGRAARRVGWCGAEDLGGGNEEAEQCEGKGEVREGEGEESGHGPLVTLSVAAGKAAIASGRVGRSEWGLECARAVN